MLRVRLSICWSRACGQQAPNASRTSAWAQTHPTASLLLPVALPQPTPKRKADQHTATHRALRLRLLGAMQQLRHAVVQAHARAQARRRRRQARRAARLLRQLADVLLPLQPGGQQRQRRGGAGRRQARHRQLRQAHRGGAAAQRLLRLRRHAREAPRPVALLRGAWEGGRRLQQRGARGAGRRGAHVRVGQVVRHAAGPPLVAGRVQGARLVALRLDDERLVLVHRHDDHLLHGINQ